MSALRTFFGESSQDTRILALLQCVRVVLSYSINFLHVECCVLTMCRPNLLLLINCPEMTRKSVRDMMFVVNGNGRQFSARGVYGVCPGHYCRSISICILGYATPPTVNRFWCGSRTQAWVHNHIAKHREPLLHMRACALQTSILGSHSRAPGEH